jgi:hypothetical protein
MDKEIETTLASLRSRHLNGIFSENSEDARNKILKLIPKDAVVGLGDSTTISQIGVKEELKKRGTRMLSGFDKAMKYSSMKEYEELSHKLRIEATVCDVFLTGTNVVTQDGRLVNVDATGNRVAGMFWGHPNSIIAAGKNKIVKDLDEAFYRLRNVVAPCHSKVKVTKGGYKRNLPCFVTGKCHDCRESERICNVFTIIEGKPSHTDMNVIVINEDLGLGWNESWPQERISKIVENYRNFVWTPPAEYQKWRRSKTAKTT